MLIYTRISQRYIITQAKTSIITLGRSIYFFYPRHVIHVVICILYVTYLYHYNYLNDSCWKSERDKYPAQIYQITGKYRCGINTRRIYTTCEINIIFTKNLYTWTEWFCVYNTTAKAASNVKCLVLQRVYCTKGWELKPRRVHILRSTSYCVFILRVSHIVSFFFIHF